MAPKLHKHYDAYNSIEDSVPTGKVGIFYIAVQMHKAGIPENFIVDAVRAAQGLDGAADLMHLWSEESDQTEKDEIIADMQNLIDASNQS